jgi:uncharacterized protein (DUF305 family)
MKGITSMKKILVYSFTVLLAGNAIGGLLNLDRFQNLNAAPRPEAPAAETAAVQKPMMDMHDRHFIEMIIPHHQDAIDMAQLAPSRAKHPEIEQLAASIIKAQTSEIGQMRTWYKTWYETDVPDVSAAMMKRHSDMMRMHQGAGMKGMHQSGMSMKIDLEALKNSSDFDRDFMHQMIRHHQMAVQMAQMLLQHTTRPEMRDLAESIIKSQTAEITQMYQWQQTWYPNSQ